MFGFLFVVLIVISVALTLIAARNDLKQLLDGEAYSEEASPESGIEAGAIEGGLFDGILCSVNGKNSVISLSCFTNEREQHFIFLPSIADTQQSYISIPDNMSIAFRDEEGNRFTLKDGDSILPLQVDRAYGAAFVHPGGESEPEEFFMVTRARGLPSIFVYTDSGNFNAINNDKEHLEPGSILIFNGEGELDYSGSLEYIKGHGNQSWLRDKKSYNIVLSREASLLGMPKSEKWVLLSNVMDLSNIRNSLAFYMSENTGFKYTPRQEYAEVYLNGNYNGLYQLMEKVSVGSGRIEINDLNLDNTMVNKAEIYNYRHISGAVSKGGCICDGYELAGNPPDITGGYIIERDYGEKFDFEVSKFTTPLGDRYVLKAPKYASIEETQYIADRFAELERRARNGEDIEDIADIKSFADKYLLEEFVKNDGAQRTSAFFYKDSDKTDPHIYAGPVWDYDKSMNADGSSFPDCNRFLSYFTWYRNHTMLFHDLIFNNERFMEMVVSEYRDNFEPMIRKLIEEKKVDALIDRIKDDDDMDSTRWDYSPTTGEYERERINTFMSERKEFFDELFLEGKYKKLCRVTIVDSMVNANTILGIIEGEKLDFDPEPRNKGDFERWYNVDTGESVDKDTVINRDMTILDQYSEE